MLIALFRASALFHKYLGVFLHKKDEACFDALYLCMTGIIEGTHICVIVSFAKAVSYRTNKYSGSKKT